MQVCRATHGDVKSCYILAKQYEPNVDYDTFASNFYNHVDNTECWVLVDIFGFVIGVIAYIFGKGQFDGTPYCQKLHWFVDKQWRGQGMRLLKHMEEDCAKRGITDIRIYLPVGMKIKGYEPVEVLYRKTNGN